METNKINIDKLKQSPIFNFSLSSKELFHSNFIAWLAIKYREELSDEFNNFFGDEEIKLKDFSKFEKIRERRKIDLTFECDNDIEIIIENKVKSLPKESQLKKYTEKFKKNDNKKRLYIILSLVKPTFLNRENKYSFELSNNKVVDWHYLSYSKFSEMIKNIYNKIGNKKNCPYLISVLKDYYKFCFSLSKIFENIKVDNSDFFNFYTEEDKLGKSLKEIRIHDIYYKIIYQQIALMIYDAIQENFSNPNEYRIIEYGNFKKFKDDEIKDDVVPIYINNDISYRTVEGLIDIKVKINKVIFCTIQIQGRKYHHALENKDASKDDKYLRCLESILNNKLWFNLNGEPYKKLISTKESKRFYKFGAEFKYKKGEFKENTSLKEIINLVISDIKKIKTNKDKILKIIKTNSK